MIVWTDEMIKQVRKFKDVFGEGVPLRVIPQSISNEELLEAINDSFEANENLLPKRFGYEKLESYKDKMY